MLFINKTTSLCNHCYRHIPAIVYENEGKILMKKKCLEHGEMNSIVEIDPEFYYNLNHQRDFVTFNQILFEVTDRCQLSCPHCYHLPDNKVTDKPIELIIDQVKKFPKDCSPMMAGAEPTLRRDFIELCWELSSLEFEELTLITNGIKFASRQFAKNSFDAGLKKLCFGLNHYSYQGKKVHTKQLHAIDNLIDLGYGIGYVGYTIESLDDVPEILDEIKKINCASIDHYRIRCGSFIGRSSDKQRSYLSNLVKKIKSILGTEVNFGEYDDNPYHVMMEWGNIKLRLIQWPDVTNIDMEELRTGPWCNFYDGPITNFVHQVITRDAYINMKLSKLDASPSRYHYKKIYDPYNTEHWKHHWNGPTNLKSFDFTINDLDMIPSNLEKKTIFLSLNRD